MGTTTTNYNLYKPDVGETGWGTDKNNSTDTIDTTMKANEDAVALNTTHRTSDGSDHTFIDQDVTSGVAPTFVGTNFTGLVAAAVGIVDSGAFYTATDVEGALQENRPLIDANTTHAASAGTDHSDVGLNNTHRASAGTDHSDVGLNNTHRASAGTDHSDVGLNNTHRTSDGSDHTYIDQSVVSGATPTFGADNLSDGGGNAIITTTQETNFGAAYTHVSNDGSDHSFIDQSVVSGATPTFGADNLSDGGGNAIITTTQETNFGTAYTHASSSGSDHSLVNSSLVSAINFVIDGGGSAITTGIKGDVEIPFACTINQVTLLADQSTTTTIDIWECTYAEFDNSTHPVVGDSITAAAVPGIVAAQKDQDSTLTGWTTSLSAGTILRFNVDANDNAERVTLSLKVTKV